MTSAPSVLCSSIKARAIAIIQKLELESADLRHAEGIANGFFYIAVNPTTSEAVGLHTVSHVLGQKYREEIDLAIGPIWIDAGGEEDAAAKLYEILKDVGRLGAER